MTWWLYQMSVKDLRYNFSHAQYRADVCQGKVTKDWEVGTIRPKGLKPQKGDMVVLFYAWIGDPEGGICGWGEVTGYDEEGKTIDFEPKKPSDHLKMKPMLDDTVKDITKRIRLGYFRGNMWEIPLDLLIPIRRMIERVKPF